MTLEVTSPLTALKGVGDALAQKFAGQGVKDVGGLVQYYPRRYEDYSVVTPVHHIQPGPVTIQAEIKQAAGRYVRRGMHITEAIASDATDSVRLVWFNQPYRAAAFKPGQQYFISGQYELGRGRFAILNPSAELASDFPLNTARIIPVYRETKGLTSKQIRKAVQGAVPLMRALPETLPAWLIKQEKLMAYGEALETIHFPASAEKLEQARRRLGFEEVLELTLAALLNKYELLGDTALAIPFDAALARQFVQHLPFRLTDAQRTVVWHIYQDMEKTQPMNRLVEGDVGSGKTVVAAMAAVMAMAGGFQAALMAPTELLARQHAETIYRLLDSLGLAGQVALLVGGMKPAEKTAARGHIAAGRARCIIGTHALIQESVDMHKLGLVVIDEQHRFGVEQRKKLMAKAGHMPHLLSLTATPIPRSLALTLYGELDVSILDTKPPGRQPVATKICSPNSRAALNAAIEKELVAGRQMFVVCPLITENNDVKANSAEKIYEQFRKQDFKKWRVALLHGKMKPQEKNDIMEQFVRHGIDILVSTTVIEVGVDVPNASIMLIEAAERFGLSQIHQLRGRVGRGGHPGYCYLMMSDSKAPPKRLEALERINDGFKLAELDLELRGPGAIYGTLQHGALDLRIAKLSDTHLIAAARRMAQTFIDQGENLLQYPQLHQHVMAARAVTNLN
ncbi:MAG TPA: ATP-dependent DNA helicase RecG [Candidatus Saccharimonadales bacterium]|nr:ATP-dependent DNA helicase RecG [Candidatus Saccharimonadales bacterium]